MPKSASPEKTHEIQEPLISDRAYFRLHVNLTRNGRENCIAGMLRCEACVLMDVCEWYRTIALDA